MLTKKLHSFFVRFSKIPGGDKKGCAEHCITFFVPAKANNKEAITAEQDSIFKAVRNFMVVELGGLTAIKTDGYFQNSKTNTVDREETIACYSYCTEEKLDANAAAIPQLANAIAIEFDQTCVSVAIDDKFYSYAPSEKYRSEYRSRLAALRGAPKDTWGYRKYVDALKDSAVTT